MESQSSPDVYAIGRRIGQGQAFALVASKCDAAQAQCLQVIRDERQFEALGLTWDAFCQRELGISRSHADHLIRNLKEFGSAYFRLSQILRISDTAFREIADAVTEESVEIDGERVPLLPANAPRIRAGIARLRAELKSARSQRPAHTLSTLRARLDHCCREIHDIARGQLDSDEQEKLRDLIEHARRRLDLIPLD